MTTLIGGIAGLVSIAVFLACVAALLVMCVMVPFIPLAIVTQTLAYRYWRKRHPWPEPVAPPMIPDALAD